MATERTGRTKPSTTWSARPKFTKWIDYLFWNNQWTNAIVQDENWENISIFADSWYELIDSWTEYTTRTKI